MPVIHYLQHFIFRHFAVLTTAIVFVIFSNTAIAQTQGDTIKTFPILERLQRQGQTLAPETQKWMKRWYGTNLDAPDFDYQEISGTSSLNLKVRKKDPTNADGYTAYGTYVTLNDSAHFDAEIAYFNLAAILGHDDIFRPTVRYALGTRAKQGFKKLLLSMSLAGMDDIRLTNRRAILKELAKPTPLKGCLKAKKLDSNIAYDAIANVKRYSPIINNPIIASLQATNPQPAVSKKLQLLPGYTGNALQLAREFSIIMTLDAVFSQWDRYSGGNVVLSKDKFGAAHFYATDNGGTEISRETVLVKQSLGYFSRYDRHTINQLKILYHFLNQPSRGYLGYTNAEKFVVDLGLYSEFKPAVYVQLLKRNLALVLQRVIANEHQFGKNAYLP